MCGESRTHGVRRGKTGPDYQRISGKRGRSPIAILNDKIMKFLFTKGAIIQRPDGSIRPRHRKELLGKPDCEIVKTYNSEVRGILNFYGMTSNFDKLAYFCYLMEYSCLFTLACKHKTTCKKIRTKYHDGRSWSIPSPTKKDKDKRVGFISFKTYKPPKEVKDVVDEYEFHGWKTTIWQRLKADVCEYCNTRMENRGIVYVVKKLKDLGSKPWELVMKKMRRKTLIVCPNCNALIHNKHVAMILTS